MLIRYYYIAYLQASHYYRQSVLIRMHVQYSRQVSKCRHKLTSVPAAKWYPTGAPTGQIC
jgi:hypothetical protein